MVAAACALATIPARAQGDIPSRFERPDLWTAIQDTIHVYLGDGPSLTPPDMETGAYKFRMPYDSTCLVDYLFTEAWHNGRKLNLRNWIWRRSVNADQNMLSFNSGTKNFKVRTGDIVSFYRGITWRHPFTGRKDTMNYFSRDTLAFAVELVSPINMARVALIDSICIMPQMPPGKARIYGHRPTMAIAGYRIPSRLDGDSVFMRIRVYARGSGEYYFTRTDMNTGGYSYILQRPTFVAEVEVLRSCCWTQIPLPVEPDDPAGPAIMSVRQAEPGSAGVNIELATAPQFAELSVTIHDAYGNPVATPFTGPVHEARTIPYQFTSRGVYIINLLNSGAVLETTKIIVTN